MPQRQVSNSEIVAAGGGGPPPPRPHIANISPLSHDKRKVEHLANLCTEQKLDPIHLPDVVTDFLRDSTGTV